jgi:putative transposase
MSPRTWRYRRQVAEGRVPPRPSRAKPPDELVTHPARISDAERDEIAAVLCEDRFCDLAPAQVYATLLDEDVYLCSIRQMYRILHERALVGERRRGHVARNHPKPIVSATGPNQAWSWDISRLRGPAPRVWFYLYVILDIWSRKLVGWTIDLTESETVAKGLIAVTCRRNHISADELLLHSDRGAQMTSTTIAELLEDLGVTRSLSRPRTSNDNPYSEAAFKTVKYRPDYPDRFATIGDARTWMRRFTWWYNHVHYHSAIGYLHPADVHDGTATEIIARRQQVLDVAYQAHPERFIAGPPVAAGPPAEAWINPPHIQTKK